LYFDLDNEGIVIEEFLKKLTEEYVDSTFYIVKSDSANKYHIFSNEVIYKNMTELKYDLKERFENEDIDMAVYGKTQLLRLPF